VRISLQSIRCYATTESDGDEIYCVVEPSGGADEKLTRIEIGNFGVGTNLSANKLLWNCKTGATIRFMENDENEPEHGSDDFVGEIVVYTDANCTTGHNTLDEGFDESKRYRQFSLQGSGAHYVVQLEIVT